MQVEIREYPALRVGAVRHVGPYMQINHAFARLGELAAPARLFERPGAQMVALFYDDPDTTPAEQLRSDAAVVVAPDVALPTGLTEQCIAAGDYASTTHVGRRRCCADNHEMTVPAVTTRAVVVGAR